jgi:hypothetical protein
MAISFSAHIRRMTMNTRHLRKGDIVELITDANAIPAGVYKVLDNKDEFLVFQVGTSIQFGVAAEFWGNFMRPVNSSNTPVTSTTDFMKRYSALLQKIRAADEPMTPYKFTFCAMDSKLMRKSGLRKPIKRGRNKMGEVIH